MIRASIVGGSGYTGGELIRILLAHPEVELFQVTSRSHLGEYVYQTHPNLRKQTQLKFSDPSNISACDILFLAQPHGEAQKKIGFFSQQAPRIIDLSADFRLRDPQFYEAWYKVPHSAPEWLPQFIYGLPELHRQELRSARYVSGVGCNATAAILSLLPFSKAGLLSDQEVIRVEIKVGSSESGAEGNPGTHHPERSGVVRTYSAFGHRHTAEVIQELNIKNISLTMSSVDLVRGAMATSHIRNLSHSSQKEIWGFYRSLANENPFIRLVKEQRGIYRVPEPKVLAGSNYADIGFEYDPENEHIVSMCAIDNLMKGASGTAVQCMNLMFGLDETTGLNFSGLHPI
jgi:N-acetyl-gamma-glutamyl-phosphate/LysW-gamma-L-alpha-aminoadipyl-6-phosphate reductase